MNILIADKFEAWGIDQLKGIAANVAYEPGTKGDALKKRVAELPAELLIVRSCKVPADVINAGTKLMGVIRAGSGFDTIDVEAASKRGVMVANCPGMNANAVSELTIGLMLSMDRKIPDNVQELRAKKWKKAEFSKSALGMKGRTIGILGAGRIGSLVAKAALGLEMNVLFYHLGRNRRLVDYPNCRRAELDDLLRESDVVTVHIPGGDSTKKLIDERRVALMKPTALLINTSRAGIIDEQAVLNALKAGKLRGAALDVFPNEPTADGDFDSPFANEPRLYGTHHIGASTEEAQMAVAVETVRLVQQYKATGQLPNCVNMQSRPTARQLLVVRLRNKPGALAHVFKIISDAGVNAEEMDHVVYNGGEAACAHIRIDRALTGAALTQMQSGHPNVIGVDQMEVE